MSGSKEFVPKYKKQMRHAPHSLVVGTSQSFRLSVDPYSENVHGAAAAFVLYGLSRGYPSAKAGSTYLALVVLLKAAMEGQINQLKLAPRLWWQVTNALTPKSTRSKGQEIRYDWNMATFNINSVPNLGGVILGPVQTSSTGGLSNINVNAIAIPSVNAAADSAMDLFAAFDEAHKSVPIVDDYKFDVSAFAYKQPLVPSPNADTFRTQYAVSLSEAPIRSWFGYCGFASSTGEGISFRTPRFFLSSQGSALQYIGARLHYPQMMHRKFNMTRLNFRSIDVSQVLDRHTKMLQFVKTKLIQAERSEVSNKLLPDAYYGNRNDQTGYFIPTQNLAILHHILNACGSYFAMSALWAGVVANGLSAMATGTNTVLPNLNQTLADSAWIVEEMSQLHPVFNQRNNMLHVPVPCISEDYIQYFRTTFADYYETTSTFCPDYGGAALDLLNSAIVGTIVSLVNGPSLHEDRVALGEIDQLYQGQNPQVSSSPKISPLRCGNVVRTRIVNGSFLFSAENYKKIFAYQRVRDGKAVERFLAFMEEKKEMRAKLKAPVRTSPLIQPLPVIADTSAIALENPQVEDQLTVPIAVYDSVSEGVAAQRLISEDIEVKIVPEGYVQIQEIQQFALSGAYAGDANNDTKTDVIRQAVRDQVDPEEIINGLDPLIELLPPRLRMIGKVAQKVAKTVAPAIQKAVQNGRRRRQEKKERKSGK